MIDSGNFPYQNERLSPLDGNVIDLSEFESISLFKFDLKRELYDVGVFV